MLQRGSGKFSIENREYEQFFQIYWTENLFYYCLITAYLHITTSVYK